MKVCTKCKKEKQYSDFGQDKRAKSGLKSSCKSCMNMYQRENGYNKYSNRPEYQKKKQSEIRLKKEHMNYMRDYLNKYQKSDSGILAELKRSLKRAKKESTKQKLTDKINLLQ